MATSLAKGLTAAIGVVAVCAAATGVSIDRHHGASAAVNEQFLAQPTPFFPSEREYPGSYRLQWKRLTDSARNTAFVTVPAWAAGIDWVDFAASSRAVSQRVLVDTSGYSSAVTEFQTVKATLGMDNANGVVIPSVPADCGDSQVPAIQSTITALHSLGAVVVLNVGTNPNANCFASADIIVNFDGTIGSYSDLARPPAWAASTNVKFWHRVYGVPQSSLATVATQARDRGATFVWFDPNAGAAESTSIPADPFWSAMLSAVRRGFQVTRTPTREAFTQQVVIPLYVTTRSDWSLVSATTTQARYIIANAANGPGLYTDPDLHGRIAAARAAGVKVLGYIATGYLGTPSGGSRSAQDVVNDGAYWQTMYGVDGFFLDEIQPECTAAPVLSSIATGLRQLPAGDVVVINPGRNFCESMVNFVDGAVNYEGYASAYSTWEPSAWSARYPTSKFWHLIYNVPQGQVATYATSSKNKRAGFVFVTTLFNPVQWFGNLSPTDWGALLNGAYLHADPRLTPPPSQSVTSSEDVPFPAKVAPQLFGGTLNSPSARPPTSANSAGALATVGSSLDSLVVPPPTFAPQQKSPQAAETPPIQIPGLSSPSISGPLTSRAAPTNAQQTRAKTKVAAKVTAVRQVIR